MIDLVTKSMSANHNGSGPARHWLWDTFQYDGFSENSAAQDIPDLYQYISLIPRDGEDDDRWLTVPLGLLHISLSLNSLTLSSSGVMVAHLTPTEYFWMAWAESMVTWSFVWCHQCEDNADHMFRSLRPDFPYRGHSI